MKYILIVIVLFSVAVLGIGVYWFQQSKSIQTDIKATAALKVLPILLDDCNFRYYHPCKVAPEGVGLESFIRFDTNRIMEKYASKTVVGYTESPNPEVFKKLDTPTNTSIQPSMKAGDIISLVSISTHINYKLLLALFAMQGESAWKGSSATNNPLGRSETNFTEQFVDTAKELSDFLINHTSESDTGVTVGDKNYPFDQNLNPGSKALYEYLASTAKSPAEFEQWVSFYNRGNPKAFWNVWQKLFGIPAFSDNPAVQIDTAPVTATEDLLSNPTP